MIFAVKAAQEVVRQGADQSGTRRRTVQSRRLVFGAKPLYLLCDQLPDEVASDHWLIAEEVETVPAGEPVIDLKAERVQEDSTDPTIDLKAERVQTDPADPTDRSSPPPAPAVQDAPKPKGGRR
jgi:hypothetical protein